MTTVLKSTTAHAECAQLAVKPVTKITKIALHVRSIVGIIIMPQTTHVPKNAKKVHIRKPSTLLVGQNSYASPATQIAKSAPVQRQTAQNAVPICG